MNMSQWVTTILDGNCSWYEMSPFEEETMVYKLSEVRPIQLKTYYKKYSFNIGIELIRIPHSTGFLSHPVALMCINKKGKHPWSIYFFVPPCSHPCIQPCHVGVCIPCKAPLKRWCYCETLVRSFECSFFNSLTEKEREKLRSCGGPCHRSIYNLLLYFF